MQSIHKFLPFFSISIFDRILSIMSAFTPVVARFKLFVMPFVLFSVQALTKHFTVDFICILLNHSIYPLSQREILIFQIPK